MEIKELRNALKAGVPVEYTTHCQNRMLERDISRKNVTDCILYGEIIEDYPLDANNVNELSFPSCLVLWIDVKDGAIHVVVGFNGRKIIFISTYHPDKEHWEDDYKTRKGK